MRIEIHDLRAPAPLIRKLNMRRRRRLNSFQLCALAGFGMILIAALIEALR